VQPPREAMAGGSVARTALAARDRRIAFRDRGCAGSPRQVQPLETRGCRDRGPGFSGTVPIAYPVAVGAKGPLARPDEDAYLRRVSLSINHQKIARDVIVVGASAGGIRAVIEVLSRLPADLPAFIGVVIHRGAASTSNWSHTLGMKTKLRVVEPGDGDSLTRGVVYVAPADCHMRFENDRIALDGGAKEHRTRPAVDPLFTSAAKAYGPRVVGVVLTGGGHDGMQGLLAVTTAGGLSLVQRPSEAEHASMPEYAIAHDHVVAALTVDEIGDALVLLARGDAVPLDDPLDIS